MGTSLRDAPAVSYFRPRIRGPELQIEDAVVAKLTAIFDRNDWPLWVGGSVQIGAGFPDLVSVWYDPKVVTLAAFDSPDGHILAYLRSVRCARINTIADRLRFSRESLARRIDRLRESSVVEQRSTDSFAVAPAWREILPEVVTVEAKVTDWQSALQQAIRNRIFAHRSYVALPEPVATRVANAAGFVLHGVGVLAVSDSGSVEIRRAARRNSPSVWTYYFHLAAIAARDLSSRSHR